MKIKDLINENLNELFGLFGDGDPIPAPEWLDDENQMLWQQKNPTEDNKRLVAQLRSIENSLVRNNLIDMANQQIKTELEMIESITETTSAGSLAAVGMSVGGMMSRQPRNSDGTARNALDSDNNLMGGPKKKKKKSSSSN